MKKQLRILLTAAVLLAAFYSLPLWLPGALANSNPATGEEASLADLPPILLWSNNWQADEDGFERNSPHMLAWQPANGEALWTLETGYAYGAAVDAQNGRIYFVEEPMRKAYAPSSPLLLSTVDLDSGELLSRTELRGRFFTNTNTGAPQPVLVLGNSLYFTNHQMLNNLAAYDLTTGTLGEERYDLCERGYVTHFEYAADADAIATLCVDFSTSEMRSSITRLSLADGSRLSLELEGMGNKEGHTTTNGLAVRGSQAYVVNSDTYAIAEIDLQRMRIVRTANYAQSTSAWERSLAWLLQQAARPAQAKMMFAVTALSPDGSQLAVGGSLLHGNRRELYVIDLDMLQTTQRVRAGGLLSQLAFANAGTLIAVYENQDGWSRATAIHLASGQESELATPVFGYLRELIVLDNQ